MKEVDSDSRRIRWASRGRMSKRVMKTQLSISIWKAQRRRRNAQWKYKSQMPTLPSILSWRCRQSSWHLENIGPQFLDCLFKWRPADILFPVRRFLVLLNSFSGRICYWHTLPDAAVCVQLSQSRIGYFWHCQCTTNTGISSSNYYYTNEDSGVCTISWRRPHQFQESSRLHAPRVSGRWWMWRPSTWP